jgi:hypothetical protein
MSFFIVTYGTFPEKFEGSFGHGKRNALKSTIKL